jgi:dephospho-CoA kinase
MRLLGITGGIATGKSTVTRMFADRGAPTLSADDIAHELLAAGTETTRAVLHAFPTCADSRNLQEPTVDRRALGRLIFADPAARLGLERLTHPAIIARLTAQAALWNTEPGACAALEIPLLFEAGLGSLVDLVVVVACRPDIQIARLSLRLGIDESEANRRIASQWPLEEKKARAHAIITTDDGFEDTRRQVLKLWNDYCTEEMKKAE